MNKYKCIKDFEIDMYDEEGCLIEGEFKIKIQKESLWRKSDSSNKIIGGEVRLENNNSWIEITETMLEELFEEV
ncbi:MAG: hypothetical protein E6182_18815 [Clostridioides difficile]|nr:hypothetical protein [Clostridioides difficile]